MKYIIITLSLLLISCGDSQPQNTEQAPAIDPLQAQKDEVYAKFLKHERLDKLRADRKTVSQNYNNRENLLFTVKRRFSTMGTKGVYEALDIWKSRMIVIYCDPKIIKRHGLGVEIKYNAVYIDELEYENIESNEFRSVKTKEFRPTYEIYDAKEIYEMAEMDKKYWDQILKLAEELNTEWWQKRQ